MQQELQQRRLVGIEPPERLALDARDTAVTSHFCCGLISITAMIVLLLEGSEGPCSRQKAATWGRSVSLLRAPKVPYLRRRPHTPAHERTSGCQFLAGSTITPDLNFPLIRSPLVRCNSSFGALLAQKVLPALDGCGEQLAGARPTFSTGLRFAQALLGWLDRSNACKRKDRSPELERCLPTAADG